LVKYAGFLFETHTDFSYNIKKDEKKGIFQVFLLTLHSNNKSV